MSKLRMVLVFGIVSLALVGWGFGQKVGLSVGGHAGQQSLSVGTAGLTAVATVVEGRYQQVTVLDPAQRAMAVYHIRLDSGQIELKSVRNIQWDLQLVEFNGVRPLPQEIQSVLTGARP